jgi:hypothetical protein
MRKKEVMPMIIGKLIKLRMLKHKITDRGPPII